MFATPWSIWAASNRVLGVHAHFRNGFILHSLHYYTFLIWPNTLVQVANPPAPPCLSHMTSICCQLLSEACLLPWLRRGTCRVPAVGLLYMAGITPTSCVPLPLGPFMWLQEEKSLPVKKSFVAGAVMQHVDEWTCTTTEWGLLWYGSELLL